ncbi:hypothetical protein Lal_00031920 [Lupinus albus]|nr:hypothetical protein Lal_00031920 [Lupinus albus]
MIEPVKLPTMQREIKPELYFSHSFFDIMVHLSILHVRETQLCRPSYMRWKYPFEHYMKILKGHQYIVEEALEFCNGYLADANFICISKSHYADRIFDEGTSGKQILPIPMIKFEQTHLYALHNVDEVELYVERYKEMFRSSNPNKNEN